MKPLVGIMAGVACFLNPLAAAEPAVAELVEPKADNPWLGQRLDFAVEIVVEGRFSGSTVFDLPELPGAILFRPEARPVLSSRQVEGREYSVQRHGFSLFCQRPGSLSVEGIKVRCGSVAKVGAEPVEHRLEVPAFAVEPRAQPGLVEGQLVVTSRSFEVEERWDPEPGEAKPGDSFQRTVTITAGDVPGMLLPRLPQPELDGLAVYPSTPSVDDRTERGAFTGRRTDSVSYLCETGGDFQLPAVRFRCWDPAGEEWILRELPAAFIGVEAVPVPEGGGATAKPTPWPRIIAVLLLLIAAITAVLILRRARNTPELEAFRNLRKACAGSSPAIALNAFHQWRALSAAVASIGGLEAALRGTEEAIVGRRPGWSGDELLKAVRLARRRTRVTGPAAVTRLAKLNP
jgi:hypothetical protein